MNKRYFIYVAVLLTILSGIGVWIFIARPDTKGIQRRTAGWYLSSQVPHPGTYRKLVRIDQRDHKNFLTHQAWYCSVVSNKFPFTEKRYNDASTGKIIEILNDSSSYSWGEYGTTEIDRTIIYYGKTDAQVGYTEIDLAGEVENYPYRSCMKWGMLRKKSMKKLLDIINREGDL